MAHLCALLLAGILALAGSLAVPATDVSAASICYWGPETTHGRSVHDDDILTMTGRVTYKVAYSCNQYNTWPSHIKVLRTSYTFTAHWAFSEDKRNTLLGVGLLPHDNNLGGADGQWHRAFVWNEANTYCYGECSFTKSVSIRSGAGIIVPYTGQSVMVWDCACDPVSNNIVALVHRYIPNTGYLTTTNNVGPYCPPGSQGC
jgi:hypothetical protein